MKRHKASPTGLIQPFSMEDRRSFVSRFANHGEMRELFPHLQQRIEMGNQVFNTKWEDAQVRVTKLDGTQFFID